MKTRSVLALALFVAVAVVQADPSTDADAPTSTAAITAKMKHDQAASKAQTAYVKALLAADQAYADALTRAEDAALRTGLNGEAEAERIKAERTKVLAEIEKLKHDGATMMDQRYMVYTWKGDKVHLVYFIADGQAVDSDKNPIRWMIVHNRMLMLWSDGNTRWMDISDDKRTMTCKSDTFTLVDPATVPPPPAPRDVQ